MWIRQLLWNLKCGESRITVEPNFVESMIYGQMVGDNRQSGWNCICVIPSILAELVKYVSNNNGGLCALDDPSIIDECGLVSMNLYLWK
jgi:hypothetical protein